MAFIDLLGRYRIVRFLCVIGGEVINKQMHLLTDTNWSAVA